MPYAMYKLGAEEPPQDGQPVGWRAVAEQGELMPHEVYVEDIPDGMAEPRWDEAESKPRFRTDGELAEEARALTTQRVAMEAAESMGVPGGPFIDANDVIGLEASILKRVIDRLGDEILDPQEQAALDLLHEQYLTGIATKQEIRDAAPEDLPAIRWRDG